MDQYLNQFNNDRPDLNPIKRPKLTVNREASTLFRVPYAGRCYENQYYQLYQYRLRELRKRVLTNCERKWDHGFQIHGMNVIRKHKVLDIQAGQPCWCIGTVYCELKNKPNILDEVVNDTYGMVEEAKAYSDPEGTDKIMLEDESGRVLLVGDLVDRTPFVTGTVIGVLGMEAEAGSFQVLDICYPAGLSQPARAPVDKSIAFVSGLKLVPNDSKLVLRAQLLQEVLSGNIGDVNEMKQVARLVICGNSVDFKGQGNAIQPSFNEFGVFLAKTLKSVPVDLLPGASDPSERSLPQQPFNKALFMQYLKPYFCSINHDLFDPVTNPYWFDYEGTQILATSGQTIEDLSKYIPLDFMGSKRDPIEYRLDLIEATLRWQNLAPTAPDTLYCFPFQDKDPFILNQWPHVYVVGNQPGFGCRKVTLEDGIVVQIVALPAFNETGEFVLLDLQNLEANIKKIDY